jgi:hypothetical protein
LQNLSFILHHNGIIRSSAFLEKLKRQHFHFFFFCVCKNKIKIMDRPTK